MHKVSVTQKKRKRKGKKEKKNLDPTAGNSTFTISLGRERKKPPAFLVQNKSQQSHTRTESISRCCPVGRAEEREDRLTDTTEGRGSSPGPNREREMHELWEMDVSDKKAPGIPVSHLGILPGFATGVLRWGRGSEKLRAEREGSGEKKMRDYKEINKNKQHKE